MRDEKKYKKYKSDTKTNRPESALSENIKLIDFRTFVHPKIRTSKIRTKKSVPKIHIKKLYRKFVHENIPPVCKKTEIQNREFTLNMILVICLKIAIPLMATINGIFVQNFKNHI